MFDMVLDVERYAQFVPWWENARVRDRKPNSYRTDQIVRYKMLRLKFAGLTRFQRPEWIEVRSSGDTVRHFDLIWRFDAVSPERCRVSVEALLELSVRPLQKLAEGLSKDAVDTLLTAFETEARRLYLTPSTPT